MQTHSKQEIYEALRLISDVEDQRRAAELFAGQAEQDNSLPDPISRKEAMKILGIADGSKFTRKYKKLLTNYGKGPRNEVFDRAEVRALKRKLDG